MTGYLVDWRDGDLSGWALYDALSHEFRELHVGETIWAGITLLAYRLDWDEHGWHFRREDGARVEPRALRLRYCSLGRLWPAHEPKPPPPMPAQEILEHDTDRISPVACPTPGKLRLE